MAKSKYDAVVRPYLFMIEGWMRDGLTLDQVAANLRISKTTLIKYRGEHPELLAALNTGKEYADIQVENALFRNALGFHYTEEAVTHKGTVVTITRYQPPSNAAIIFWLKNRLPAKWRDKAEVEHDVTQSLADILQRAWTDAPERG